MIRLAMGYSRLKWALSLTAGGMWFFFATALAIGTRVYFVDERGFRRDDIAINYPPSQWLVVSSAAVVFGVVWIICSIKRGR